MFLLLGWYVASMPLQSFAVSNGGALLVSLLTVASTWSACAVWDRRRAKINSKVPR